MTRKRQSPPRLATPRQIFAHVFELSMVQFRRNSDGSVTEIPPTHCPNGHELRYLNVIVAQWPKPGAGRHFRCWHCLTCRATV